MASSTQASPLITHPGASAAVPARNAAVLVNLGKAPPWSPSSMARWFWDDCGLVGASLSTLVAATLSTTDPSVEGVDAQYDIELPRGSGPQVPQDDPREERDIAQNRPSPLCVIPVAAAAAAPRRGTEGRGRRRRLL